MSMTLILEVSSGINEEAVVSALDGISVRDLSGADNELKAMLPSSGAVMTAKLAVADEEILAENLQNPGWLVGGRIYFDINPARENALADVERFVRNLSEKSPFRFVLSFEYETLYAENGPDGLRFTDNFRR